MKLAACFLTAAALGSSGCGVRGSSDSPSDRSTDGGVCPSVAACGGAIVAGTYTITSFCGHVSPASADGVCQSATESSDNELSGTFWFDGSTTYMIEGTEALRSTLYLPASCLSELGVGTCSELEFIPNPIETARMSTTCTGTSTCTCTTVGSKAVLEQGAYLPSGKNLTLANYSNNVNTHFSYCVSGNQIAMSSTDTGTITSIVLTRQDGVSVPPDGAVTTDAIGAN